LTANTEDEAIRTASHLTHLILKEKTELTKDSLSNESINHIERLKRDFRLEKLKIFSKQGEIIFSTNPKDIGKKNKHEYFYNIIAKGNVFTKVVQKNTKSLEGRIVTADVVDVSDSVVVACGAPEIRAKGALLYNVSDEGGVAANIGDVRVDAYLPPDERVVLHTRLDRNGRNDWETRLPGNALSYAELHRRNASVDPVEAAAMAADQRAGVRHGKGKR